MDRQCTDITRELADDRITEPIIIQVEDVLNDLETSSEALNDLEIST